MFLGNIRKPNETGLIDRIPTNCCAKPYGRVQQVKTRWSVEIMVSLNARVQQFVAFNSDIINMADGTYSRCRPIVGLRLKFFD